MVPCIGRQGAGITRTAIVSYPVPTLGPDPGTRPASILALCPDGTLRGGPEIQDRPRLRAGDADAAHAKNSISSGRAVPRICAVGSSAHGRRALIGFWPSEGHFYNLRTASRAPRSRCVSPAVPSRSSPRASGSPSICGRAGRRRLPGNGKIRRSPVTAGLFVLLQNRRRRAPSDSSETSSAPSKHQPITALPARGCRTL